ncbi:Cytoplasmic tRNA 2-thiolation protein 1 [Yarrowia sp. C11]|nr:Cytoplasmic tRNA 2-thiolation protein 1 [Yarrowia sp. E02]KAG5367663.1 Cytoplasmic tRNA 2-thiolation protein 1 [Yarrowia sp. C11]
MLCVLCDCRKAVLKRPKTLQPICRPCFYHVFETEIHNTIVESKLFYPGERVAIGASGGKDSTVLAHVMKTLNERYNYGVDFVLLSIDEGIHGYRDDSLETVKRNKVQYDMDLEVVSYSELYGWSMDQIVAQIGNKNNCTYCGVFRRQALDRGSAKLGIAHIVTGHNADDMAETVLMNLLRGDTARLDRCTELVTGSDDSPVKRSKPLKYAYEKEIVLYAHYKKLDYFSTECTYSPEAFRGTARTLIKNLEAIRPSTIIDIIHSGEAFVLKKKKERKGKGTVVVKETKKMEDKPVSTGCSVPLAFDSSLGLSNRCTKCGYLSHNAVCKACVLLEGLNAGRAKLQIEGDSADGAAKNIKTLEKLALSI